MSVVFIWCHVMMKQFFRGWRQRAGCVALLLAYLAWYAPIVVGNREYRWQTAQSTSAIMFRHGIVYWSKSWNSDGSEVPRGRSGVFVLPPKGIYRPFDPANHTHDWQVDLGVLQIHRFHSIMQSMNAWQFSYWTLFPSLTLLSAYLLLWKRRKSS